MSGSLDDLLQELHRRFPNRNLAMAGGEPPHLRFPAIHAEVGDIEIYDDGDEFTVIYGNFTHSHYDKAWVETLINDLDALFSDRLKMWGSRKSAGGIVHDGYRAACTSSTRRSTICLVRST